MYIIRHSELLRAVDQDSHLVKLIVPEVYKSIWSKGLGEWSAGYEILSEAIGISLFTTGTKEKIHYHDKTWEIYQVLRGALRIFVKPSDNAEWASIILGELDMVVLVPGTIHFVDATSNHITQVIQAPPALLDQKIIENIDEIKAIEKALLPQKVSIKEKI